MSIATPNVDKWKQVHAILAEQAGGGTETIDYQANDAMSELQRMLPDRKLQPSMSRDVACGQMTDSIFAEVSLDNLHQLRRSQHSKIVALKSRITSLRAELVEKQDPGRMQETQRLISVRRYGMTPHLGNPVAKHNRSFTGPYRPSKRYP
jgi:hypothetical protein